MCVPPPPMFPSMRPTDKALCRSVLAQWATGGLQSPPLRPHLTQSRSERRPAWGLRLTGAQRCSLGAEGPRGGIIGAPVRGGAVTLREGSLALPAGRPSRVCPRALLFLQCPEDAPETAAHGSTPGAQAQKGAVLLIILPPSLCFLSGAP